MIQEQIFYDHLSDVIFIRWSAKVEGVVYYREWVPLKPFSGITPPKDIEAHRMSARLYLGQMIGNRPLLPMREPNPSSAPSWTRQDLMPTPPFKWAGKATRKKTHALAG